MFKLLGKLFYNISISAIVGALVAGGAIYYSNTRVDEGLRAELAAIAQQQTALAEQQNATNVALMQANEDLASALGALENGRDTELQALRQSLDTLSQSFRDLAADKTLEVQVAQIIEQLAAIRTRLDTLETAAPLTDMTDETATSSEGN